MDIYHVLTKTGTQLEPPGTIRNQLEPAENHLELSGTSREPPGTSRTRWSVCFIYLYFVFHKCMYVFKRCFMCRIIKNYKQHLCSKEPFLTLCSISLYQYITKKQLFSTEISLSVDTSQ